MATVAEIRAYSKAQDEIVAAARERLNALWFQLGDKVWDIDYSKAALAEFFPVLVAEYGDAAAVLAAEWFEQQIAASALLAPGVGPEAARWGAWGAIKPNDPGQTLATVGGVLDRMVKQAGRDTVRDSAGKNRVLWARVPSSLNPCAFCVMLASRGAVYVSAETADASRYHDDCGCVATPFQDGEEYDPSRFLAQYSEALQVTNLRIDTTATLAEMRRRLGTN